MLMCFKMALPVPLIFLLMIHGVSSADWGVSYKPLHICALNNSSVIMSCTFTYPTGHQISKVFWTKDTVRGKEPPDLSEDPEYSQRLQYLGDKQQNCTMRLSHVTQKDSNKYYFRFITNKFDGKWIGTPGVTLTVTDDFDLQVESPERVTEGDSVRLTCKSSCTLTDRATFIWYRNSQPLTERRDRNNELLLQSVRRKDAGRYSCAVHGHNHTSPAVQLNVMYPPRSISVSISPSGEIVSGDSVTLNCSSDSNPPAEISWFKGETFVRAGRIYSISKISSDDSGEYKCKSINEHGEKYSDAVTLNVMYPPRNISVSINKSGEIVSGDSVTLNCSSDSNPPAEISWYKGGTSVSGRIYSISKISSDDSGQYKCKSINKHGEKYSDAVTLNVMYPPRNVSVLIKRSGEIMPGDSVTLICSSDSNPPALNFRWFKENESSAVGSRQSFSALQSGRFYCQAHNQHGSQRSDAVTVTVHHGAGRNVIENTAASGGFIVIIIIMFIIIIIIIIFFILKKQRSVKTEDPTAKQNNLHSDASQRVSVHDEPLSEPDSANDAPYDSVKPNRFGGKTPESRDTEEDQYTTAQHLRKEEKKRLEETECQNDDIRVHLPEAAV
ncbi:B-cell receptor CD22-like isoform X3 [Megalobrama amblycephala]|uniref:B-cell receptor CD22-like isoform X3 n=1 Tax=Megalobrama amblycephala TaxID=75352 RepID=UPI002013D651|nr:B-cell receptor CD22-like isoform X3 [Megalobrama amblycephala]